MKRKPTPTSLRQEQMLILACLQRPRPAPAWASLPSPATQEAMLRRWCQLQQRLKGATQ